MKLYVSEVQVIEGYLYERMSEGENIVVYDLFVRAICDGEIYDHKHLFKGCFQDEEGFYRVNYGAKVEAEHLANRVKEAGVINTDHWNAIGHVDELFKSQEERLEEAWSDASDHYEHEWSYL